jgi:hypothetical protein
VKSRSAVCRKQSPGRHIGDRYQLGQRAFERNIINQNIRSGQRTNIQLKGHKERYYLDFDGHIGQLLKSGSVLFGFRWAHWAAYMSQDWYYLDFAGRLGRIGRLYESGQVLFGFRWAHWAAL